MDVSITEIHRRTGLDRAHISRALRGQSGLSLRSAKLIADAAGMSIDELVRYIDASVQGDGGDNKP